MPAEKAQFPASINIANFNGMNGFSFMGFPPSSCGGSAVAKVGDINADGIADLAIGATNANTVYVIFGQIGVGSFGKFNVSSLTGTNGFAIKCPAASAGGFSVSAAGDVNKDGISDLVIGAWGAYSENGAAYVIFGKSGIGSSGILAISSLNGANGFVITGFPTYSEAGTAVSGGGDINADGVADLVVGAPYFSSDTGTCYVIFGQTGIGNTGTFSVASLTGVNGFVVTGFPAGSEGGNLVRFVGDINADGVSDLVVNNYVIFGKSGIGSSGSFSVSSLNGGNGFVINGFSIPGANNNVVNGAGDVNGDGIADLIVGAPETPPCATFCTGASYVIFGQSGIGSSGVFSIFSLTGPNGFVITGFPGGGMAGYAVNGAGDINADGIADLVVGVPYFSPCSGFYCTGASYIIFGKPGLGSSGVLSVSSLTGLNGFSIIGFPVDNFAGSGFSGIGDFNGDGIADLLIGSCFWSSPLCIGASYVLFGEEPAFSLIANGLTIAEKQTLVITSQFLNATNPKQVAKDGALRFTFSGIQHGYFFPTTNVNVTLTSFTQQQVRSGQIQFAHDGSVWAPAYNVSVSYPGMFTATPSQPATINFEQSFVLINNHLTVNQGQTVILSSSNLSANDLYNSANNPGLVFVVSHVQYGYFALVSSPTIPITRFTQAQIQSGSVQFMHNGSPNPPTYSVAVINGAASTSVQAASISFDIPPILTANTLIINQGHTVVLSAGNLNVTDPYSTNFSFSVSNVAHGYFAFVTSPTAAITSFTNVQVKNGNVQFAHDGTATPPSYNVMVSDGRMMSAIQAASISFDIMPTLLANTLTINQAQTIILSSSNLNAVNPYVIASSLLFTVNNVQHGFFALVSSPTIPITSFTQAQVQSSNVQFVHDGSANPPSYDISITDGRMTSPVQSGVISFDVPPTLATNSLTISQGQTVILNSNNLSAYDPFTSTFTFTVSNVQHGYFSFVSSPTIPITSFTQVQIQNGVVQFVQDGSTNPPSYSVSVSDGRMSSAVQISAVSFGALPIITNNHLSVNQGQPVILTSSDLDAKDPYNSAAILTFTVSNIAHGYFELNTNAGLAITSFTQTQIQNGEVQFVPDGSVNPPSYSVSVSNGGIATPSQPSIVSFDVAPVLVQNSLTVNQGQTVILTINNLFVTSNSVSASDLVFTMSQVQHGYFALVSSPTTPITSFTQVQLQAEQVQFVADGTENSPSYSVSVSDGQASTVGGAQLSAITFNAIPILVTNQLTIIQGQTVVITNSDLAATDQGVSVGSLIFTASSIQHGHFEDINSPGVQTTVFTQQRVMSGGMKFISDGSASAPTYDIAVGDGILSSSPSAAIINFSLSSEASLIATNNTDTIIRNGIIGGAVSGGIGLLFLALKLCLTRRATTSLKKALEEGGESELEKVQAVYYKEVLRPIANRVFEKINTTYVLGYRSDKTAIAYVEAVEKIILDLSRLGINLLEVNQMEPIERIALTNEIAKQARKIVVPKRGFCSAAKFYSFFKPEATPEQIENQSQRIARAVQSALGDDLDAPLSQSDAVELTEMPLEVKAS